MTPQEAIHEIKNASDSEVRYGDTKHNYDAVMKRIEAFAIAIKAIELMDSNYTDAYIEGFEDAKQLYE